MTALYRGTLLAGVTPQPPQPPLLVAVEHAATLEKTSAFATPSQHVPVVTVNIRLYLLTRV